MLARIEGTTVVEWRDIAIDDVPAHKRDRWRTVEGEPPPYDPQIAILVGPDIVIEPHRVVRTYTIEPRIPLLSDYEVAIEAHLEAAARSRGYKSEASILSYVNSSNPVWAAEAQAYAGWRDAVWAEAYAVLADVQLAARPPPSLPELLAILPQIQWPD